MKANWFLTSTLILSSLVFQTARAEEEKSLEQYTAKITQLLREALSKQNLRTQGTLDPFPIVNESGLVVVVDNEPVFTGEGGGQNGAFATVDKEKKKINIEFTNTWVHRLSSIYCLKSAVESKKTSDGQTYFVIAKGQENKCIEVAAVSEDMSLDHSGWTSFGNKDRAKALVLTPEYNFDFSIKNGHLKITPVEYEGGTTKVGQFAEEIYIWNRSILTSGDKNQFADRYNDLVEKIGKRKMTPVASIDQGKMSKTDLLQAMKNVEWGSYNVPSLRTNVEKARQALSLLSPSARPEGEKILNAIKEYQIARNNQKEAAEKDGLNGTPEFQQFAKDCDAMWKRDHGYGKNPACHDLREQRQELFKKSRENATYLKYEEEMQTVFPKIQSSLQGLVMNADKDPSVINFLIEIQPSTGE